MLLHFFNFCAMFVPEKNKLNKFKLVRIPRKVEQFSRFGFMSAPASAFSGDDPGLQQKTKIDSLADMDAYDRMMQREEYNKSEK